VVDGLRAELQRDVETSRRRVESDRPVAHTHAAPLRSAILDVQAEELARLRSAGEISAETFRHVQLQLDKEHSRLSD
jgi:hypothetical protein